MSYELPGCWAEQYSAIFKDKSVVDAYKHRPEYPAESFKILKGLIPGNHASKALDLGCGTGFIARHLDFCDEVDAVDCSAEMVRVGKNLPAATKVNWMVGRAEEADCRGPYNIVIAGASLHWMNWYELFPRLKTAMTKDALLVRMTCGPMEPWRSEIKPTLKKFSMNQEFKAMSVTEELTNRGLFEIVGSKFTESYSIEQSLDEYVESFHARNGLSRDRMDSDDAAIFDSEIESAVSKYVENGVLRLRIYAQIEWGKIL